MDRIYPRADLCALQNVIIQYFGQKKAPTWGQVSEIFYSVGPLLASLKSSRKPSVREPAPRARSRLIWSAVREILTGLDSFPDAGRPRFIIFFPRKERGGC